MHINGTTDLLNSLVKMVTVQLEYFAWYFVSTQEERDKIWKAIELNSVPDIQDALINTNIDVNCYLTDVSWLNINVNSFDRKT